MDCVQVKERVGNTEPIEKDLVSVHLKILGKLSVRRRLHL